ncbi:hypothetical protein LX32DRAFT_162400 [Colletotrichum zoysiae]|uniref:Uncharacterized protein n=1 Tax=Colletotrichum zoysiae TaxID=1216348 RepID=A0AAD9H899_9PEZI|nr:hypothetical protein LX32DRAFT_162400 [Colletotrichum zoysiae]
MPARRHALWRRVICSVQSLLRFGVDAGRPEWLRGEAFTPRRPSPESTHAPEMPCLCVCSFVCEGEGVAQAGRQAGRQSLLPRISSVHPFRLPLCLARVVHTPHPDPQTLPRTHRYLIRRHSVGFLFVDLLAC